jgi:hypothetical protein
MNNIYFPVQVAALLRRLVNAMATFSISGQYLRSMVRTEDIKPDAPDIIIAAASKDSWWNKWDWLRVGLLVNNVLETRRISTDPHWASEGGTFLVFDAHRGS